MSLCYATIFSIKIGSSFALNQVGNYLSINLKGHQYLIRDLIYLAYETKPDIAFVIGQLSYYNSNLQTGHIYITKQTLQYLKRISIFNIVLGINFIDHQDKDDKYRPYKMVNYANNNYLKNIDN